MRYEKNIDKENLNLVVNAFEADLNVTVERNFNKRSSVTWRGGRPYSYSPVEIAEKMIVYFRECVENEQPFMVTGLCLNIGISREGLRKLEKSYNNQFVDTIKKGKQMIEYYLEIQCHLMPNPTFPIFVLKNMGWDDKERIRSVTTMEISDKERQEALERIKNFSE